MYAYLGEEEEAMVDFKQGENHPAFHSEAITDNMFVYAIHVVLYYNLVFQSHDDILYMPSGLL